MKMLWVATLTVVSSLAVNPVFGDPPHKGAGKHEDGERGNGKGKGKGKDRYDDGRQLDRERGSKGGPDAANGRHVETSRSPGTVRQHFDDRHRSIVREYYVAEYRSGHCPPGLAKKNNGCMPPGQAKRWSKGQPLPREVVFYEIPPALVVRIGTPPPGYRYVRVATDILLIAVGTGMVIDAITDLGNL
jgi:Ni/Co efflux regulator RcnB